MLLRRIVNHLSWYSLALLVIAGFALFIRVYNLSLYNPYWGDDGGAHLQYIEVLAYDHRLPSMQETYLAWHEPLYYLIMAPAFLLFGLTGIKVLHALVFVVLLLLVYRIAALVTSHKATILATLIVVAVVFSGVKISSYPTNELLTQVWILLLVYLLLRFDGYTSMRYRFVVFFALLLGIGLWIKLSVVLVLCAAGVFWLFTAIKDRSWRPLLLLLITASVSLLVYSPWIVYKQYAFGNGITINSYEQSSRQPLFNRAGLRLLTRINLAPFRSNPYWQSQPHSFVTILAADMVSDYYHLFDHVDYQALVSPFPQKITGNGRPVTPWMWERSLWVNRAGAVVLLFLGVGICGALYHAIQGKKQSRDSLQRLLCIILIGIGFAALVYNVMRLPFLERGTLKFHFIYFTLPLMAIVSYDWWGRVISSRWVLYVLVFGPLMLYTIVAWPVMFIQLY